MRAGLWNRAAKTLSALRLDMRTLVTDGRVDAGVMEFMVSRCGDFVRYLLPLKGTTLLLWFGPGVLFVLVPLPAAAGDALRGSPRDFPIC